MNYRMVLYVLGRIFLVEAALLVIPLACALPVRRKHLAVLPHPPLRRWCCWAGRWGCAAPKTQTIYARDGLVVAALAWVLLSAFGALPFYLSAGDPLVHRRLFRDGLRLYHDRLDHPHRCRGHEPRHAVLAQLFPLGWRHGRARVPDGRAAADRRPRHAPDAGRSARPFGRQDLQPPAGTAPRSCTRSIWS